MEEQHCGAFARQGMLTGEQSQKGAEGVRKEPYIYGAGTVQDTMWGIGKGGYRGTRTPTLEHDMKGMERNTSRMENLTSEERWKVQASSWQPGPRAYFPREPRRTTPVQSLQWDLGWVGPERPRDSGQKRRPGAAPAGGLRESKSRRWPRGATCAQADLPSAQRWAAQPLFLLRGAKAARAAPPKQLRQLSEEPGWLRQPALNSPLNTSSWREEPLQPPGTSSPPERSLCPAAWESQSRQLQPAPPPRRCPLPPSPLPCPPTQPLAPSFQCIVPCPHALCRRVLSGWYLHACPSFWNSFVRSLLSRSPSPTATGCFSLQQLFASACPFWHLVSTLSLLTENF